MRSLLIVVCLSLFLLPEINAQDFGRAEETIANGTAYHVFQRPGEVTIQVLVLGAVGSPGIYEVGIDTDLGELFALTGGAALGARERREKREVEVQLFRQEGGRRTLVYEAPMEEMLAEPSAYPPLQEGDVFLVEATVNPGITWIEGARIVSSLGTVVLLIDRILRWTN